MIHCMLTVGIMVDWIELLLKTDYVRQTSWAAILFEKVIANQEPMCYLSLVKLASTISGLFHHLTIGIP